MPNPKTPILDIDELVPNQAQPHVLVNEGFRELEKAAVAGFGEVREASATFTPELTDWGAYIRATAALTCTLPADSVVALPIGFSFQLRRHTASAVAFAAGAGATVNRRGLSLIAQHATARAIKVAEDTWDIVGEVF